MSKRTLLKTPMGLITLSQVCKRLGVSRSTVTRWQDGGYFRGNKFKPYVNLPTFPKAIMICGQYFFQAAEIENWQKKVFNNAA